MKKYISLVLIIFILLQLPVLLKAQQVAMFLKLGDYIDADNTSQTYRGLIVIAQVGAGAACSPCTVPSLPKPERGTTVPVKIVFNMTNSAAATYTKELMFRRGVVTNAYFVFTRPVAGKVLPFYWIVLSNVIVDEINEVNNSADPHGTIQVTLAYSAITYALQKYSLGGVAEGPRVTAGWNFAGNVPTTLPLPN